MYIIYMCIYKIFIYIYIYIYTYICIYIYIYIYIYIHIYVYVYIYICVCICIKCIKTLYVHPATLIEVNSTTSVFYRIF